MKYVKRVDEANKKAMSYKLSNDDKHDVERLWFKEIKDKRKHESPGDVKDWISKMLGINYFEVSSYIDREILGESKVNEKKVPVNRETIEFHIDSYKVSDDPYDVAKEIGDSYNWTQKEIEKAEKLIRKYYIKESEKEIKKTQRLMKKHHIKESTDEKVTKKMWDRDWKNDFDKREQALLTIFQDPDDAERWIEAKWDSLPPQASHMYTEKLEAYPLADEPFHGSGDLGKEIKPVKNKNRMKTLKTFEQFSGGTEEVDEGKCPEKGCTKKVGKNWRVISNKTGKLWPQHYDTEKDAKAAIGAYHS
jgi:hypothetical protein